MKQQIDRQIVPPATIGVVGLGLMGAACVERLRAAGFGVLGHDIDPRQAERIGLAPAERADTLSRIAQECDAAVIAVFSTAQVKAVLEGPGGLAQARSLAAAAGPLTTICISTCDPDALATMAAGLPRAQIAFVEMPVSGTSQQFVRGEALGLLAANEADLARVVPVIDAMVGKWHRVGGAGDGARAKLAINLILGINRAALAEGLVFAQRMGLDPSAFLAVARDSAAWSQIMDVKGAKMIAGDFTPHGKVTQSLKDFTLMLDQAQRLGQQLPLGETYAALMRGCVEAGEADLDNGAVIREIGRRRR